MVFKIEYLSKGFMIGNGVVEVLRACKFVRALVSVGLLGSASSGRKDSYTKRSIYFQTLILNTAFLMILIYLSQFLAFFKIIMVLVVNTDILTVL